MTDNYQPIQFHIEPEKIGSSELNVLREFACRVARSFVLPTLGNTRKNKKTSRLATAG